MTTSNCYLGKSIKQAASLSNPDLKRQLPQLNGILNAARLDKIPVDGAVVKDLHDKLAPLVKQNDEQAWETTLALASYRSVFNENPFASFSAKPVTINRGQSLYDPGEPPQGERVPVFAASESPASRETGAEYEPIGKDLNPGAVATNAFLSLTYGGVVLDDHHLRNAVFIGVHVVYNGGPLILENVVFINCNFSISNTSFGHDLVAKSFASGNVSFTAG